MKKSKQIKNLKEELKTDPAKALNSIFKEVYADKITDLIRDSMVYGTAFFRFAPADFTKKYGDKYWGELSSEQQDYILKHGMKKWEKKKDFKDDFDGIVNDQK